MLPSHARNQKNQAVGVGRGLFYIFFHQRILQSAERTSLEKQMDEVALERLYVRVFQRKPMASCDFPGSLYLEVYAYAIIVHTQADQLLPQLSMEQFDT